MASIQDKVYLTPLDLAVDRNHSDIAKFLGANGALTMAKIVGIAATRIQALYRSIFSVTFELRYTCKLKSI